MNCKNCGKEINNKIKFCPHCGFRLNNNIDNDFIVYIAISILILVFISIIWYAIGSKNRIDPRDKELLSSEIIVSTVKQLNKLEKNLDKTMISDSVYENDHTLHLFLEEYHKEVNAMEREYFSLENKRGLIEDIFYIIFKSNDINVKDDKIQKPKLDFITHYDAGYEGFSVDYKLIASKYREKISSGMSKYLELMDEEEYDLTMDGGMSDEEYKKWFLERYIKRWGKYLQDYPNSEMAEEIKRKIKNRFN